MPYSHFTIQIAYDRLNPLKVMLEEGRLLLVFIRAVYLGNATTKTDKSLSNSEITAKSVEILHCRSAARFTRVPDYLPRANFKRLLRREALPLSCD
jgi:hypothetical protein